jgi:membrane protease YdiL (CAAX protease family)
MSDPDQIPIARAVACSDIPFCEFPADAPVVPTVPAAMRPLRAFMELLIMLPIAIAGASIAFIIYSVWHVIDFRWVNVLSSVTMGVPVLVYIRLMVWLDDERGEAIGWTTRRFWRNVGVGLGTFALAYAYAMLMALVLMRLLPSMFTEEPAAQKAIQKTFPNMHLGPMILMMLFVSIWEEVAFRGFLLTRLQVILRHWWLTVPVGALIFGSIHLYEGPFAAIVIAGMGFIMGILFVWRKSLVPSIVFHFANNMVMLQILRWVSSDW